MFRTDCCNVYGQNLVRNLKVVRGGLGEHRGMESENEEVNEIVESNGLKVEQLPLNIDNWGEGKVRQFWMKMQETKMQRKKSYSEEK